jgi:hypothetical protein
MADRDPGAKRGLFRRGTRAETDAPEVTPEADSPGPRRDRRSSGEMFAKSGNFEDPWSSDAWAEDGWNDEWADPKSRASVRPAAAPRSADVDAWLQSDQTEFADATADTARKWVPDAGAKLGATWDEPEVSPMQVGSAGAAEVAVPTALTPPPIVDPVAVELERSLAWVEPPKPFPAKQEAQLPSAPSFMKSTEPKLEAPKPEVIETKFESKAPVVETPVEKAVIETPVIETPVVETPVVETPVDEKPVAKPPVIETAAVKMPTVDAPANSAPANKIFEPAKESVKEAVHEPVKESAPQKPLAPIAPVGATWDAEPELPEPPTATANASTVSTPIFAQTQAAEVLEVDSTLDAALTSEFPNASGSITPLPIPEKAILGDGWDDAPVTWKDDPVVRSLDDDFVQDYTGEIEVSSLPADLERRSIPRTVPQSLVPEQYDDLDRSIDLDLAEELDHELATYVRPDRKAGRQIPTAPVAKAKKLKPEPEPISTPKRAPIVAPQSVSPQSVDDDVWDDVDPNALAASRLDTELNDAPALTKPIDRALNAPAKPANSLAKPTLPKANAPAADLSGPIGVPKAEKISLEKTGAESTAEGKTAPEAPEVSNVPKLASKRVPGSATVPSQLGGETSAPKRQWSPPPQATASDMSVVRLLMTSGLALAALAVVRLVVALVATVKASSETNSFGDRLVDASNNLGPEQSVLLILAVTLAILGRYVAHGRIEAVNRLTGRACGVILAASCATLLLSVARVINEVGTDGANFASSAQAFVEFLAVGGMSIVAMVAAWSTSAE